MIAVIASALRGKRYMYSPATPEPVSEELAEGAAQTAEAFGLDESAGLPEFGANLDHADGNGSGREHRGNGVRTATATSGSEPEQGASPEGG